MQAGRCEILFDSIQAFAERARSQGADVTLESLGGHEPRLPDVRTRRSAKRRSIAPHWRGNRRASCVRRRSGFAASGAGARHETPTSNSISTSSSSDPDSAAAFPRFGSPKRAIELPSWKWAGAGRPRTCHAPVGRSIAGSGGRGSGCAASSTCGSSGTSPSCTAAPWAADPSPTPAPCFALPTKCGSMGSWTGLADWKEEMPQHFDTASRMLGIIENRILGPADHLLKKALKPADVATPSIAPSVGIFQSGAGEPVRQTYPDPFFGGEGPERSTCNACGGCMMGCQHGAKNTLDLNYLYLAEKRGVQVFPETKVSRCEAAAPVQAMAAPDTKCAPSSPPRGFAGSRGASPVAAWFSPPPRWAPWSCSFISGRRAHCLRSAGGWENMCAPIPNRSSACEYQVASDDLSQGHRHRLRRLH